MVMSTQMIQQVLSATTLSENELSEQVLVPCLSAISVREGLTLRGLRFTGGTSELGNDIEYYEVFGPDSLRFWTGIQVKKGNVGQGQATELINQGVQAFDKDILDPSSGHKYRINRWVIAATGSITAQAKTEILKQLERYAKPINFWDGLFLADLIQRHFYRDFVTLMGVDARLAASENVQLNLWDPDQPVALARGFAAKEFAPVSIESAVPPGARGLIVTVRPDDKNLPSVRCVLRSRVHEIVVDSVQSQLQPYILRVDAGGTIEAMVADPSRPVSILARGYVDER